MRYLVDVNLPKKFRFFNTPDFVFVVDMHATLPDAEIWTYALANDLVILTKDTDFYTRSITTDPRPKIIHFRLGNQTLAGLHQYFSENWSALTNLIETHSLIIAYPIRIDVIL